MTLLIHEPHLQVSVSMTYLLIYVYMGGGKRAKEGENEPGCSKMLGL